MKYSTRSISFIVTALNEENSIEEVTRRVYEAAKRTIPEFEIILVNDGSTDHTGPIMDQLAQEFPEVRVIHNERNLGLGGAYRRGIEAARCEYVMWINGDNPQTVKYYQNHLHWIGKADVVAPYYHFVGRPRYRKILSRSYSALLNFLFGLNVRFYNGLVVYRRDLVQKTSFRTDSFAFQAEILIQLLRRGYSCVQPKFVNYETPSAGSKALRLKNIISVLATIMRLWVTEILLKTHIDTKELIP